MICYIDVICMAGLTVVLTVICYIDVSFKVGLIVVDSDLLYRCAL